MKFTCGAGRNGRSFVSGDDVIVRHRWCRRSITYGVSYPLRLLLLLLLRLSESCCFFKWWRSLCYCAEAQRRLNSNLPVHRAGMESAATRDFKSELRIGTCFVVAVWNEKMAFGWSLRNSAHPQYRRILFITTYY